MEKLIGSYVVDQKDNKVAFGTYAGEGKIVGLYFSAQWCPPCKGFTPSLIKFYNYHNEKSSGAKFEIVFVSSDRDEATFKSYYAEMPWLALQYSERERKNKLSKHFKVHGIPSLVFVDGKTGKVICADGRAKVMEEKDWDKFPWPPKPFQEIISGDLQKQDGTVNAVEIQGKYIGLYFSAHWCPPCKKFTPELVKCYEKLIKAGKPFEMIFVSSDRTEDSFKEYYRTMPWLAIPYKDSRCTELSSVFEVSGIPCLIILDKDGTIVTSQGRAAVTSDPEGTEFPWIPKLLNELTDATAATLNEEACMLLLTDGTADEMSKARDLLQDTADRFTAKEEDMDLFFFYGGDDEVCESLRDFLKLPNDKSLLLIADIQEGRMSVSPIRDGAITKEVIAKMADEYEAGTLEYTNLPGGLGQSMSQTE